ncbi:vWA domain-containing protein [Flavobacterium ginsenosidimutans]|uniref:VWA domain-containing protein n=1 Tax=Flavobacterium ginsenosidimutans TaxID=687844 RepID=UPI000DAD2094|nr:VWA domain-containing protein [Flavobacterium ginsenosidimutans]KAF2330539.1 VWA domain-containing protein [Flavobacterium ginsenosidimutans]
MSSINLQESQLSGCATYVAIVVDESGSINGNEAQQIRDGLTSFINSQAQSNITLSLIGMSNSDTAVRLDNVIQKKISSNHQDFIDWIDLYGLGNESIQSDYWASGLNVAKNLSVTPDIVFVVTDGLQVNNSEFLKNLFTELNLSSKVFVYGVTSSFDTIEELTTPLTNFLGRTPILKNDQTSALDSDYIRVPDFSTLGYELNRLATNLSDLQIGCFPSVSIIDDNLVYPSLKKGVRISKPCGTLFLKNKSRVPLTLSGGTKIHREKNLNGLIFKLDNSVTIPGKSEVEVPIRIEGKALELGHFSALVDLSNVFNPLGISINFNVGRESSIIDISSEKTNLQSAYLQIATAGSRGIDSTKGIHLRWMLNGKLGDNHLPKGELYDGENSNSSFNKPDDFVKVYRAPYTKISQTVDLTQNPNVVDNKKALWIYKTGNPQRSVYVNFKDDKKYKLIKLGIDPLTNPVAFMQAYGNSLIEIETKTDLFFAAELDFSSSNVSKSVKLETLSVAENKITASKNVSSRKTYNSEQLNNKIRLVAENGRSIRFKANYCLLNTIQFEFYFDFITNANTKGDWILKGKYGLATDDFKVFEQLEPKLNAVHGKWLKFNDGEYVNIKNYKAKWNRPTVANDITDENIKDIVLEYIELSKSDNPRAEKDIHFGDLIPVNDPKDGEEQQYAENLTEISYLDILNIAANDYHVARMLGLGCLDLDDEVYNGEYVYLTEYTTFGSLEDGIEGKEMQHLSMSIPTSINTERMPLPVQLNKIVPGLNAGSDENSNAQITDPEGYSFDGKKRYVSLFMDDVMDYDTVNPNSKNDFFKSSSEYDGSTFTFPVYLGIDHKIASETTWKNPELSHDVEYKSVNGKLEELNYETVPINIPEPGKSVLNAIQEQTGENTYIYQGYGINIFSRAASGRQISIKSDIKPANNLMPPSNMNALLVTEENPLLFTSQSEQQLLSKITGADKTLVRIMFDYYSAQELLSYPVPKEITVEDAETDTESIFPDTEEILADHFKLYYKDGLPEVEYGEIEIIDNDTTNNLTAIVKIREYKIISSGQQVKIGLDNANKTRFAGGILTIGDQNYIIQNIEVKLKKDENSNDVFDYALIEVLKKEVTDKLHADGDATIDSEQIQNINLPESRLCTLVQNMQTASNWHQPQINFTVQYPESLNTIHREVIDHTNENGENLQVEKTRGVWNKAVIERFFEDSYEMDENGEYKVNEEGNLIPLDEKKHLGLYKIIFRNFSLPQHSQFKSEKENSVEWSNGIVRLFTKTAFKAGNSVPVKSRKEFKVYKTENIGSTGNLVLYIDDPDFKLGNYATQTMAEDYDEILGAEDGPREENESPSYPNEYVSQCVNYYPSYKVYLYADPVSGITKENIQPRENESTHYSSFGISTYSKPVIGYKSKISIPCPMYAVKVEKTEKPEEIIGGSLYATRPDFYNRSTFTFTTKYNEDRKPYGLLHYRANDEDLLNVLYKPTTVSTIREELNKLGGNDEIDFNKRWADFLDFNELATRGQYDFFPKNESEEKYQFPLPDNEEFIVLINDFIKWHNQTQGTQERTITSIKSLNQVLISQAVQYPMLAVYFIEQAIHNAFVPLTEVPVIYEYIKDDKYVPVNKKQTIKDKNGNALKPTDADFDIAPMMKVVSETENRVQFTDFNLDGNSQNIYFYAVREMDIKMNFGEFSDLLGPVKLVASTPPKTPEIKRIMPILENQVLGIKPAVQIELNAYQPEYKIRKINIYRAATMLEAQSIRTMKLAKEIVINEDTLSADFENVWTVYDDFEDLEEVPFGDGLFYRITVSKQIEYADPESTTDNPIINIDYTPSQPSKITATVIVDNISPESPILEASGTVTGTNGEIFKPVVFNWEKTVYNGKYHLYKMNGQGNWEKIHEISTNLENVALPLQQTKLKTDQLIIKNEDGDRIYHHFKVISENASGMLSSEEKILTL